MGVDAWLWCLEFKKRVHVMNNISRFALYTLPFFAFLVAIPLAQIDFMGRVPGDIGDSRLNAYFLEHIWQVLVGKANSFVHLPFFAPNLWVGSFSDNHWGTAFIYVIARALGQDSVASFQIWWLFAYVANFSAALYAFRLLKFSPLAATVGALFFVFALPVAAHTYNHAQLSYRFGAVLAFAFYIRFLVDGRAIHFLWALFFTVWQTYATIYIGFFTLISLLFITLAYFRFFFLPWTRINALIAPAAEGIRKLDKAAKVKYTTIAFALLVLFVMAFVPYFFPADVFGISRNRSEIWTMLPRVSSYFYTASSALWIPGGWVFDQIPVRHEHQMFVGIGALGLIAIGVVASKRHPETETARILWVGLLGIVIVTLNSDGVSLWIIFSDLPLASAIRAMTRIDLVMLFFAAGLIAVAVDQALKSGLLLRVAVGVLALVVAVESAMLRTTTMAVSSIRETATVDLESIIGQLPDDAILFFAQSYNTALIPQQPWFAMEIRAMWTGLALGYPVLNGYSGKLPPGSRAEFGDDCSEAGTRLRAAYRSWPVLEQTYGPMEQMIERLHLVGFPEDCTLEDVAISARTEVRNAPLPRDIAATIRLRLVESELDSLVVEIVNSGSVDLVPRSFGPDVVNIAWRWPDIRENGFSRGPPLEPIWAGEGMQFRLPISQAERAKFGALEISLVQEGQFWFHDVGMEPLALP